MQYSCRICTGAQENKPLTTIAGEYSVYRCSFCGFMTVHPPPTPQKLNNFYQDYHFTKIDNIRPFQQDLERFQDRIIDFLLQNIEIGHTPRFLDFGFGDGIFLRRIAQRGFTATGIEVSEENCENLEAYIRQTKSNIEILRISSRYPTDVMNKPFDCITLFEVIEHALDPVALIRYLACLQEKGGILYIECPNNDALYLKVKNMIRNQIAREDHFFSLRPPEHLHGFNRASLKELLKRGGYSLLMVEDYRVGDGKHQVRTLFDWYPSIKKILFKKEFRNTYLILQWLHKILDLPAHLFFRSGTGLCALAKRENKRNGQDNSSYD